jgi:uncharacterized membrane protein SpoIIM required for sporulation
MFMELPALLLMTTQSVSLQYQLRHNQINGRGCKSPFHY